MKKYERSDCGWIGICTFSSNLPFSTYYDTERVSYSSFHRFITMKNFTSENSNKMMACLYGGRKGSHLSPNGLAVQYYGFGYPLAPDASAYESYWSKDYTYHGGPCGSNTIPQGYNEISSDINTGYYVDIFRSDIDDNDYIFHNVGKELSLKDYSGKLFTMQNCDSISSLGGVDYKYFANVSKTVCNEGFIAEWSITDSINSRLWFTGCYGRLLYKSDAPSTTLLKELTPDGVSSSPLKTPTLLVRQKYNSAGDKPFISVYEPFIGKKSSIKSIEGLNSNGKDIGVKVYHGDRIDYVISTDIKEKEYSDNIISLFGSFGYISTYGNDVSILYLGNGTKISYSDISIQSVTGEQLYVSIYKLNGSTYYSSTGDIILKMNNKVMTLAEGYNIKLDIN